MGTSEGQGNFEKLKAVSESLGVDLFGTAVIDSDTRGRFDSSIREIAAGLGSAVVIGVRLSGPVLQTVVTGPTWTYYYHYRMVNYFLDQAALFISGECQRMGYKSLPIPASQILDWDLLKGHLSHRSIGEIAGLGWRGRNNLLVNPDFGSQARYTTILTDMPLPDGREKSAGLSCGDCVKCLDVCPVDAIHESPADFDLDRCAAQLRRFSKSEKLNTMICGLCVKVCGGRLDGYDKDGGYED